MFNIELSALIQKEIMFRSKYLLYKINDFFSFIIIWSNEPPSYPPPNIGWIVPVLSFYKDGLGINNPWTLICHYKKKLLMYLPTESVWFEIRIKSN